MPKHYICVTHNNKLGELINEYSGKSYKITNCEIIKFCLNENGVIIKIESIYKEPNIVSTVLYENGAEPESYIFYAVRHGEGEHNTHQILAKISSNYTDPPLTDRGKDQSYNAGEKFSKYIADNGITIEKYFVSSLMRTTETLYNFLLGVKGIDKPGPGAHSSLRPAYIGGTDDGETIVVTVLPESEEFSKSIMKGYENNSSCVLTGERQSKINCSQFRYENIKLLLKLDWTFYDDSKYSSHKNMFVNAIGIITGNIPVTGGRVFKNRNKKTHRNKRKNRKTNRNRGGHR